MRIAFAGRAGVGKTTGANYLAKTYGGTVFSFATKLKEIVSDLWEIDAWDKSPRARELLQKVGTEAFRSVDPDVWVNYLVRQIGKVSGNIYVDDVRFPNEANALISLGFTLIKVIRPGVELQGDQGGHSSETAVDLLEGELAILNNKDFGYFFGQLNTVVTRITRLSTCFDPSGFPWAIRE